MKILKTKQDVRRTVADWRQKSARVGAVPTMGALHEGHLSLVDTIRSHSDQVIVSIFVNPIQFGPSEDFATYPRKTDEDLDLLRSRGCDAVFMPDRDEMFAPDFSTRVLVEGTTQGYCSLTRPHFFEGVATIVTKLLLVMMPDCAAFGEKDYQQLVTIRRLVRDLDIPVEIIGGRTVREPDGLAMSSRNLYLTAEERAVAPVLFRTLTSAKERLEAGAAPKRFTIRRRGHS